MSFVVCLQQYDMLPQSSHSIHYTRYCALGGWVYCWRLVLKSKILRLLLHSSSVAGNVNKCLEQLRWDIYEIAVVVVLLCWYSSCCCCLYRKDMQRFTKSQPPPPTDRLLRLRMRVIHPVPFTSQSFPTLLFSVFSLAWHDGNEDNLQGPDQNNWK